MRLSIKQEQAGSHAVWIHPASWKELGVVHEHSHSSFDPMSTAAPLMHKQAQGRIR